MQGKKLPFVSMNCGVGLGCSRRYPQHAQVIQQEENTAMVRTFDSSFSNCLFCCFLLGVQLGYNHINLMMHFQCNNWSVTLCNQDEDSEKEVVKTTEAPKGIGIEVKHK